MSKRKNQIEQKLKELERHVSETDLLMDILVKELDAFVKDGDAGKGMVALKSINAMHLLRCCRRIVWGVSTSISEVVSNMVDQKDKPDQVMN